MTGFLDSLAERVRPDRSALRPRPDALLLARLQPTATTPEYPVVEDDRSPVAPPQPRPGAHVPPPVADIIATATAADQPALPEPLTRRLELHTDTSRFNALVSSPRPADQPGAPTVIATPPALATPTVIATPPGLAAPTRTSGRPERAPETPSPQRSTAPSTPSTPSQDSRPLTSRPTSDPATPASILRSPTAARSPISIIARPNESRARDGRPHDAEQPRNGSADVTPVEIVIDRVDVRLQSAAQPARPPRTGPRAPMTLERYLESRQQSSNGRPP